MKTIEEIIYKFEHCAYNFCKARMSTMAIPCKCLDGHTQSCCKGISN